MDLKIPPLVVVLISILAQFDARDYVPVYSLHFIPDWIPVLWVCFGLLICLLGVVEFVKHKTTVNPTKPETTKSIVDTGIFHYTRNPMYVGMTISLIGSGLWIADVSTLIGVIFFIFYINEFQIKPEERALEALFPDEFSDYKKRVRRWL